MLKEQATNQRTGTSLIAGVVMVDKWFGLKCECGETADLMVVIPDNGYKKWVCPVCSKIYETWENEIYQEAPMEVICKKCEYFKEVLEEKMITPGNTMGFVKHLCKYEAVNKRNYVTGETVNVYVKCEDRNHSGRCHRYEKKKRALFKGKRWTLTT
jgi:hypothetical protein